ncbi:MAG: riboflavin biosynthesis protein RibF [Planctomycetota bacterium]|nr:MAG: riboflavin biosynthesis protein RibF [Planctomycetota bacterium]
MMEFMGLDNVRADQLRAPVVTLGTFDGVHLGHRRVLEETLAWARDVGGHAVVVTFDRHPRGVLGHRPTLCITSLEHRLELFRQIGVDCAVVLKFHAATAGTAPEEFAGRVFHDAIGARRVVLGFDCRFGKGRAGGIDTLRDMRADDGGPLFEVREAPPVYIDGRKVSSTDIRAAIEAGDLDGAARYLGRPYSIMGKVIHGDSRGHDMGYPTANLNLHHEIGPPTGVYHTRVVFKTGAYRGRAFTSVTNVGTRPTFPTGSHGGRIWVETHILDEFHDNVYGERMEVIFVRRLRAERKFASGKSLAEAIKKDIEQVRKLE